ncbi:hypothetical protein AMTRI_Chr09g16710 [Amborella trichopoda]
MHAPIFSLINPSPCSLNLFPSLTLTLSFPKLKPPPMSSSPFINPTQFQCPQTLAEWLKPRLPYDLHSWGTVPGTKNITNLWLELFHGETLITDSIPPTRTLNVAIVNVRNTDGQLLLEEKQEMSDGSVRERMRPLSEKMKPGESIEGAAMRAIREELGFALGSFDGVKIVKETYKTQVEEKVSASYPGLPARYVLHCVEARIDCLPNGEFFTEEGEYEGLSFAEDAVRVIRHYWKWVQSSKDAASG